MSIKFLQGFEQVAPTNDTIGQVLPGELTAHFGFQAPSVVTDWFINEAGTQDETSGPAIIAEGRCGGQSMIVRRPDALTNNAAFNGSVVTMLSRAHGDEAKAVIGCAFKFDSVPTAAIPLMRMSQGGDEQVCLWADTDGSLFLGATDFDPLLTTTQTSTAVATTDPLVFNFQAWSYVELSVEYDGADNVVTIDCNNVRVLTQTSGALRKAAVGTIDTVSIVNVQNTYFDAGAYEVQYDDVYILDGAGTRNTEALGPQYIVMLPATYPAVTEMRVTGALDAVAAVGGTLDKTDLAASLIGSSDTFYFDLGDLDGSLGQVNAIAITAFAEVAAGSEDFTITVTEGAETSDDVTAVTSVDPTLLEAYHDGTPSDEDWTRARLRTVGISIGV